jgi:hypothetical protein
VLIALPALAAAQRITPVSGKSARIPYPSIGLPLPTIGLPLPPLGLPPVHTAPPRIHGAHRPIHGGHQTRGFHGQRRHFGAKKGFPSIPTYVYIVPPYGYYDWPFAPTPVVPTVTPIRERLPERLFGLLWLEVQPGNAQVYADGYYVGVADDFVRGLELEAGPHRIEIRAPGYETLAFDVRMEPDRSITYRGDLKPIEAKPITRPPDSQVPAAPVVAPAAPAATTFYVIPGCYVGNVSPNNVKLPPTCDLAQLVTYNP